MEGLQGLLRSEIVLLVEVFVLKLCSSLLWRVDALMEVCELEDYGSTCYSYSLRVISLNISARSPVSVRHFLMGTIGLFREIKLGALPILVEIVGVRSVHTSRRYDRLDCDAFQAVGIAGTA